MTGLGLAPGARGSGLRSPLILRRNRRKRKPVREIKNTGSPYFGFKLKESQKEENPERQAKQNQGPLISTCGSATV